MSERISWCGLEAMCMLFIMEDPEILNFSWTCGQMWLFGFYNPVPFLGVQHMGVFSVCFWWIHQNINDESNTTMGGAEDGITWGHPSLLDMYFPRQLQGLGYYQSLLKGTMRKCPACNVSGKPVPTSFSLPQIIPPSRVTSFVYAEHCYNNLFSGHRK